MRQFDESAQSEQIGFELGFDMYRFGIRLDSMPHFESVEKGHLAAETQNVSRLKMQSVYEKKWIQIRIRAFTKGITVNLTPDDLQDALKKTHGKCPIIDEKLTFNTGFDTDWSVDRVNNDIGYTADNIFIMSSRANVYKSDISLTHLMRYVLGDHDNVSEEEPRFKEHNKDFWSRLFLCLYRKMPAQSFLDTCNAIFYGEKDRTDSIVSGMVQIIMTNDYFNPSLKGFEKAIMASPTMSYYIGIGALQKSDLRKLRKISITVRKVRPFMGSKEANEPGCWEGTYSLFIEKARQAKIDGIFLQMKEDVKVMDNLLPILVEILDFCLIKWRDKLPACRYNRAA